MAVLCGHEFLADLPICLVCSFRYVSSTGPIIIAKGLLSSGGLAAKRTGYVPDILGKKCYSNKGSTGLAVRYADLWLT